MKKSILALAVSGLLTTAIIAGCTTPAEKVENAQENVNDANKDLDKANEAYLLEIEAYKKVTSDRIMANDSAIAEINARLEKEKKDASADYKKQIADLEQKNTDLKNKMNDYKPDSKEKWEAFKTEFSHDMDELGKAFKGLTVKNVK